MSRNFFIILSITISFFIFFSCGNPNPLVENYDYICSAKRPNTEIYKIIDLPKNDNNRNNVIDLRIDDLYKDDIYFIVTTVSSNSFVSNSSNGTKNVEVLANKVENTTKRGKESISKFNERPFAYIDSKTNVKISNNRSNNFSILKKSVNAGDTRNFYDDEGNTVYTTCRLAKTVDGKTLNIWVQNKYWSTTPDVSNPVKNLINQDMIDTLADKFLKDDKADIYHWVTNIFGYEWGVHNDSNLIPASELSNINILLYDIDNDEDKSTGKSDDGVLGFFHPRDNFKKHYYSESNEMLMFYIDAPTFSYKEKASWNINDTYPSEIVSTLVHEFQHMIHFYQKCVKHGTTYNSETWLNEMCSLVAEDFLADKLGVNGPRGVSGNNPSSKPPNNYDGRLPMFNVYNGEDITKWLEDDDVLKSYSTSYAFGAYIARNFGGVELFKQIVSVNTDTNYKAVINSINSLKGESSETLLSLLQKWGAAVVLSDLITTDIDTGYRYNNGSSWYSSTLNGYTYNLGSINLYNYKYYGKTGPYFQNAIDISSSTVTTNNNSNFYIKVGEKSGTFYQRLRLLPNQYVTILLKR